MITIQDYIDIWRDLGFRELAYRQSHIRCFKDDASGRVYWANKKTMTIRCGPKYSCSVSVLMYWQHLIMKKRYGVTPL
jgi:hypothetical protein